jgi:CubicO group peptidase (beta-lactamase class C family)
VQEAFIRNFTSHGELGASLCVRIDGRVVIDVWGGLTDVGGPPFGPETLVNSFSVGKGVTALLAMACVERGVLSYDDRVSAWWPNFVGGGKENLTISGLLGHRAGLPALRANVDDEVMYDWATMTGLLAEEHPWWEPGTGHGYHVNTFGFLVGEVLRRATGRNPAELLDDTLRGPLGADLHFGVPSGEHGRIATLLWNDGPRAADDTTGDDEMSVMFRHAHANPPGLSGVGHVNSPRWRSAVLPSTNLHASARGVCAAFQYPLSSGTSTETLAVATTEVSNGLDRVLGSDTRFGCGFQLPLPWRNFGPEDASFGHFGAGGSLGFCDPVHRISFGYVMNRMGRGWQNERNRGLVDALYASL